MKSSTRISITPRPCRICPPRIHRCSAVSASSCALIHRGENWVYIPALTEKAVSSIHPPHGFSSHPSLARSVSAFGFHHLRAARCDGNSVDPRGYRDSFIQQIETRCQADIPGSDPGALAANPRPRDRVTESYRSPDRESKHFCWETGFHVIHRSAVGRWKVYCERSTKTLEKMDGIAGELEIFMQAGLSNRTSDRHRF